MREVAWHAVGREELASLLHDGKRLSSHAVGATTIYRLEHDGHEILAMALPDGHALIVERSPQAKWRRRINDALGGSTPGSR